MSFLSIFFISISLAMDAFAVSISAGLSQKRVLLRQAFVLALCFWVYQAVMPLIGWVGWVSVREYIEPIDHWIAFVLLGALGVKMIYEALSDDEESVRDYFSLRSLMILGFATSIDALAVGISLALMPVDILHAVYMIGWVTFVLCFFGVYIGKRFGHIFEKKAEILGWLILIAIGTKILIEHLFF